MRIDVLNYRTENLGEADVRLSDILQRCNLDFMQSGLFLTKTFLLSFRKNHNIFLL